MNYYILQENVNKGPYTIGQLRSLWNSGSITSQTLYYQEGFSEWLPLATIIADLEPSQPSSKLPPQPSPVSQKPPIVAGARLFKVKKEYVIIILGILFWVGVFIVESSFNGKQENKLPPPPLKIGFRDSITDSSGKVLQVQNTSDKGVSCVLDYGGEKNRFFLKPYEMIEIGPLEIGKSFKSGETFKLDAEGYLEQWALPVP